jgi:hypothetical protein
MTRNINQMTSRCECVLLAARVRPGRERPQSRSNTACRLQVHVHCGCCGCTAALPYRISPALYLLPCKTVSMLQVRVEGDTLHQRECFKAAVAVAVCLEVLGPDKVDDALVASDAVPLAVDRPAAVAQISSTASCPAVQGGGALTHTTFSYFCLSCRLLHTTQTPAPTHTQERKLCGAMCACTSTAQRPVLQHR